MTNSGWTNITSPFHAGELTIQDRLGVKEQIDKQGRRVIRDYLPEQHRQFFAQLPYALVGTVDEAGDPWASILVGEPGFLTSSNRFTLRVAAQPLQGDPLSSILKAGIDIGLLGIELHTRRRNRLNGIVTTIDAAGFEIEVRQCFGNCPQYIQARMSEWDDRNSISSPTVKRITVLGETARSIVMAADTFFIATAYRDPCAGAASGVDVSHRGGKTGFVRTDDELTLTVPDFAGNHHFNTFGNLGLNPHAGLLFIDFDSGDLLYLTGTACVIWDESEVGLYAGAERLLRFQLSHGYLVNSILPLHWSEPQFSPFLYRMGAW